MANVPGVYTRELEERRYVLTEQGLVRGRAVVLDRETRSPLAPDWWSGDHSASARPARRR